MWCMFVYFSGPIVAEKVLNKLILIAHVACVVLLLLCVFVSYLTGVSVKSILKEFLGEDEQDKGD